MNIFSFQIFTNRVVKVTKSNYFVNLNVVQGARRSPISEVAAIESYEAHP